MGIVLMKYLIKSNISYIHHIFHFCNYVEARFSDTVQIRSFFWSLFSSIQSEYRKIRTRKKLSLWTLFTQCLYVYRFIAKWVFRTAGLTSTYLGPLTVNGLTVFWCFPGEEKGCIENKWVNKTFSQNNVLNDS